MAREKVDNKLNVVIGTKAQVLDDTTIPDNSIVIVTDEELKANEIVYDDDKNVEEAIDELETQVALRVLKSDIVNNLNSNDTDKPLSANQGKVLNDTTAKLAVSNVFTQPQQVPNATLPQHTVNKLQVETMFEMFKRELRSYNFAIPDLTDKEHLGNGVYRLTSQNGGHLDYDILNGHHRIHGSFTGPLSYNFGTRPTGIVYAQIWEVDKVALPAETSIVFLGGGELSQVMINNTTPYSGKSPTYNQDYLIHTYRNSWTGTNDIDITFKVKLEKGSTATPYTVPGQIPQYKIVGEA